MYGTREVNHRKVILLKEYKGKYFTTFREKILYKVTNVILDSFSNKLRLVYVEVYVKHKHNPIAGEYKELVNQRDLYFMSVAHFGESMNVVIEKEEKFRLAYTAD